MRMHKRMDYLTRSYRYRYKFPSTSSQETVLQLGVGLTTWLLALGNLGRQRLREFEKAPQSVQDAFWHELARRNDQRRQLEIVGAELADDPLAQVQPEPHTTGLQWDAKWQRKSRAVRVAQEAPETDWTPDREADPLRDIPARVYVEALTGEEVPHSGRIACPLPDHRGTNMQAFRVGEHGWRCFSCGKSGTIYDLASILWGIHPRGQGFVEIHKRLRAMFDTGLAAA